MNFLMVLSFVAMPAEASPRSASVDWLAAHASPLRPAASMNAEDDDYSDLAAFGKAVSGARVVLLGEQSHGDGAAFLTKTRLVRFLHQKMGFTVLAFETGLWDARKVREELEAGRDGRSAARKGLSIWGYSDQIAPLLDYLSANALGKKRIELAGFDCQTFLEYSRDDLPGAAEAMLRKLPRSSDKSELAKDVRETLKELADYKIKPADRERDRRLALIQEALDALEQPASKDALGESERDFWRQIMRSTLAFASYHWSTEMTPAAEANNARDAQMAENLLWLINERHPNAKIVVWAANYHVMRGHGGMEPVQGALRRASKGFLAPEFHDWVFEGLLPTARALLGLANGQAIGPKTVTMGRRLAQSLGARMYSVGVMSSEGRWGLPGQRSRKIPRPATVNLEADFASTGHEQAFLDFRRIEENGAWLRRSRPARLYWGYEDMIADWSEVYDGVLFIRRMTPSTFSGKTAL